MIIIRFQGGLGNQMFQYALYKKMQIIHGKEHVRADFACADDKQSGLLTDLFNLNLIQASKKDISKMADNSDDLFHMIRRKFFGRKKTYVSESESAVYREEVLNLDNVYMEGYWQTEKYFSDIRDLILQDFNFQEEKMSQYQKELLNELKNKNSVGVHVRRGDYLSETNSKLYGNICDEKYYKMAMNYKVFQMPSVRFFIFSNDTSWTKSKFRGNNIVHVEYDKNQEIGNYDMFLLSQCKHNIIANSSFSWWAAWLNPNGKKTVVSPSKWMNESSTPNIWCDNWIRI